MKPMNFPGRKDQRRKEAIQRFADSDNFKDPEKGFKIKEIITNTQAKLSHDTWNIRTKKHR